LQVDAVCEEIGDDASKDRPNVRRDDARTSMVRATEGRVETFLGEV
jgi:hypothetical protein